MNLFESWQYKVAVYGFVFDKKVIEEMIFWKLLLWYPYHFNILGNLIDHIIKTDEVQKHQERLRKQRVFDKLEQ